MSTKKFFCRYILFAIAISTSCLACGGFIDEKLVIEQLELKGQLDAGFFEEDPEATIIVLASDGTGHSFSTLVNQGTEENSPSLFSLTLPTNQKYLLSFLKQADPEDIYIGFLNFFVDEKRITRRSVFNIAIPTTDTPIDLGLVKIQKENTLPENSPTWSFIWSNNNPLTQIDTDGDGISDFFDDDDDNDEIPDSQEKDSTLNGVPDDLAISIDTDGDGIINQYDTE